VPGLTAGASEGFRHAVEEMERRLQLPYFWDALTRSARGLVNAYTLGGQHALWRQAERVLAPTLLVYGGRDQLVGFRMAQRAARAFRDSRLLTLPEAGHVAMMEYPETVAGAFRDFVSTKDFVADKDTVSGKADEVDKAVASSGRVGRATGPQDRGEAGTASGGGADATAVGS